MRHHYYHEIRAKLFHGLQSVEKNISKLILLEAVLTFSFIDIFS